MTVGLKKLGISFVLFCCFTITFLSFTKIKTCDSSEHFVAKYEQQLSVVTR